MRTAAITVIVGFACVLHHSIDAMEFSVYRSRRYGSWNREYTCSRAQSTLQLPRRKLVTQKNVTEVIEIMTRFKTMVF